MSHDPSGGPPGDGPGHGPDVRPLDVDGITAVAVGTVAWAVALVVALVLRDQLAAIYLLNALVSLLTTFFAPAEAAMIPVLVARRQLVPANGLFTLTLNAAFALGFALLGPAVVRIAGPEAAIIVVAVLFLFASLFWAAFEQAWGGGALRRWRDRLVGMEARVRRTLLVDAPLAPLRTGRQPQVEDRRPLSEI